MRPHWTKTILAENERLRQEIAELRFAPTLARFAHEIGDNLMLMLANIPFEHWPALAKTAYNRACEGQETTAYFYRERLPQA